MNISKPQNDASRTHTVCPGQPTSSAINVPFRRLTGRGLKAQRPDILIRMVEAAQEQQLPGSFFDGLIRPGLLETLLTVNWEQARVDFAIAPFSRELKARSANAATSATLAPMPRSAASTIDVPWHYVVDYAFSRRHGTDPSLTPPPIDLFLHYTPKKLNLDSTVQGVPVSGVIRLVNDRDLLVTLRLIDDTNLFSIGRVGYHALMEVGIADPRISDIPPEPVPVGFGFTKVPGGGSGKTYSFHADAQNDIEIAFTTSLTTPLGNYSAILEIDTVDGTVTVPVSATVSRASLVVVPSGAGSHSLRPGQAGYIYFMVTATGPDTTVRITPSAPAGIISPPFVIKVPGGNQTSFHRLPVRVAETCPSGDYTIRVGYAGNEGAEAGSFDVAMNVEQGFFYFEAGDMNTGNVQSRFFSLIISTDGYVYWDVELEDSSSWLEGGDKYTFDWYANDSVSDTGTYSGFGDGRAGSLEAGEIKFIRSGPVANDWVRNNWKRLIDGGITLRLTAEGDIDIEIKWPFEGGFKGGDRTSDPWAGA